MVHLNLIITMFSWGFNAAIIKLLLNSISSESLLLLRILLATFFLLIVCACTKQHKKNKFTIESLYLSLAGGFLYIYLQLVLHFMGIVHSAAANAVLIAALAPFIAMVLEKIFFKRIYQKHQINGVVIAFCGVAIASIGYDNSTLSLLGISIIFLSVVISCLGGVVIQKMARQHSSLMIVLILHLSAFAFFILDVILFREIKYQEIINISLPNWGLILIFSVLNGGVASIVWARGVSVLGIAATTAYLPLVPLFGLFSSSMMLNEQLNIFNAIGLIGVFAGSIMATGTLWNMVRLVIVPEKSGR